MVKKIRGAFVVFSLLNMLLLFGCETIKGAGEGMKKDWESAKKADGWMQDNLW